MADTTVTRYGRDFIFDEGTPEDVQNKRIDSWMRQNAPSELQAPQATTPVPARTSTADPASRLAEVARTLNNPLLSMFASAVSPSGQARLGDPNFYRTLAQGTVPFADEATAGVRSMIPGQPDYTTALGQERQGLKDYEKRYGVGDRIATELGGAGLGVAATMGAGALLQGSRLAQALPWLTRAGEWIAANPRKSAPVIGAGTGAVTGFGAGEGGLENRLKSAAENAETGAVLGPLGYASVRAAEKGLGSLNANNRVADFLRRRLLSEREGLATSPTLPRNKAGDIDPNNPAFTDAATRDLRTNLNDQRTRLYTNPVLADLLPDTAEEVLQKRGPQTEQLARTLMARQYDKNAPLATANAMGQRGRVESAFDLAFGHDNFRKTDTDLVNQMKANAKQLFEPAYQFNIRSPEIDDALNRLSILDPSNSIWKKAKSWIEAKNKSAGSIDATGNMTSYNTEFLHNIKRALDEHLGEAGRLNPKFNDVPWLSVKTDLNNAMKEQNGAYKTAMEQFGDDAQLVDALRKGREEVFQPGSVDKTGGMNGEDIKKYLADPSIPQAQKDLFRLGAARALRENTLASTSKKWTHNWADFINNPETEDRMGSLLTDKLGSWDLLRAQLKKESENYKAANKAMGNSRTSARLAMQQELEDAGGTGKLLAGVTNPGAFGNIKNWTDIVMNKIGMPSKIANRTAGILGRTGAAGNRSSLNEIEALLRAQDARRDLYGRAANVAPAIAGYGWPFRADE